MSDGAEVTIPAFAASDNSAEQVVAGIAAALPSSLFTSREHFLGCLEGVLADQGDMGRWIRGAPKLDASYMDGIAEDVKHSDCTPGSTGSRLMAMTVQPVSESPCSEFLGDVKVEDGPYRCRFSLIGFQLGNGWVVAIAVGIGSSEPPTSSCLAFHAGDHAVYQCGAFKLGEHAKHLNHHSARRRPGVEGLSCRAEDNMRVVELFENLCQSANRARETIDSIDEHEVKATKSAISQSALQLRSLQSATSHAIAVAARQLPALLAGDVSAKACVLGLE
ncbi:MAG TPA: hypothetical protein VJT78_06680 [Candidatus Dormibacteraeota bacterium]|nr:hypothetical protein [Candidatus Dormibacteraeota bacterium]